MVTTELGELLTRKEELDAELVPYVRSSPTLGGVLHHPLIISIMFGPTLYALTNAQFRAKKAKLAQYVAEKDHVGFVFMHERPYRLDAFARAADEVGPMPAKRFWQLLSAVWTDSENIFEDLRLWRDLWGRETPHRQSVMSAAERKALLALPGEFEVYRGINNRRGRRGLSWTIDRDKAVWFANRWDNARKTPELITGVVAKHDVLAYFLGRNEKEIVVLPEHVRDQRVERARTKKREHEID